MNNRVGRFWRTIKYLKPIQLRYQFYHRLRKIGGRNITISDVEERVRAIHKPPSIDWLPAQKSYAEGEFHFLNQSKKFERSINWNFPDFGKLWTYHLNYFDYLMQPEMDKETGLHIIRDFIDNEQQITVGLEAYPTSLRIFNWIKFSLRHNINASSVNQSLYQQLQLLQGNIEYHLLGNHLWENGCALLAGGLYFDESKILELAKEILQEQLAEQILEDGGHFERSPMYHQLLLHRLLDCYHLLSIHPEENEDLGKLIGNAIEKMTGWLQNITFRNGSIPRVNDAVNGWSPETGQLINYGERLGLNIADILLGESGYRMIRGVDYEWLIDVGDIGPDYIPGHAHSDTFSFVLHVHEKPVIVDTGVSTYEECDRRVNERATAAHNTVKVGNKEQTEVWKSFRVGRRARVTRCREESNFIDAEHNGYRHLGLTHRRIFKWASGGLFVKDFITGKKSRMSTAFLHFHPNVEVEERGEFIYADHIKLAFRGYEDISINDYDYASGFNQLMAARVVEIKFRDELETRLIL
ncbi:MAG TPA: alginate lyase family protein [Balneolaceae bacterium]|nr:alginate lyase family protein [Balneolaceae bacterium]